MTQQRYSQQGMIEKLQELAARLGRSPTQVDATTAADVLCHTCPGYFSHPLDLAGMLGSLDWGGFVSSSTA
jgi:hypothetical protein